MAEILGAFEKYQKGEDGDWLVSPEALSDRLDAKYIRHLVSEGTVPALGRAWRGGGRTLDPSRAH